MHARTHARTHERMYAHSHTDSHTYRHACKQPIDIDTLPEGNGDRASHQTARLCRWVEATSEGRRFVKLARRCAEKGVVRSAPMMCLCCEVVPGRAKRPFLGPDAWEGKREEPHHGTRLDTHHHHYYTTNLGTTTTAATNPSHVREREKRGVSRLYTSNVEDGGGPIKEGL
ncbi:hypothetical protein BS50DRAFT_382991 [Corynespora cassiicola Philippines]|uniref:Uncharacterized protein n=1 Tax=Corynespora cassiicola Philippines TaxID=1448308 RepID=A0A2T2NNU6_CORCC|nr:hypothetical protein BS50DRAFT_382991 [Corynespora cassiicola Philippines]